MPNQPKNNVVAKIQDLFHECPSAELEYECVEVRYRGESFEAIRLLGRAIPMALTFHEDRCELGYALRHLGVEHGVWKVIELLPIATINYQPDWFRTAVVETLHNNGVPITDELRELAQKDSHKPNSQGSGKLPLPFPDGWLEGDAE